MKDIKWRLRVEKRMVRKLRSIFLKQQKWVLDNLRDLTIFTDEPVQTNALRIRTNTIDDQIEAFIQKMPYVGELAREIVTFMRVSLKRGGEQLVKELEMKKLYGISFDVTNPTAEAFLKDKLSHELSDYAGNIDTTTKNRLNEVLVEGYRAGESYTEIGERIQKLSVEGVFSEARGKLIAVRELGVAYEEGNSEVVNEFKSKYPARQVLKKWQTVGDDRVTPAHRENGAMGWIDETQRFTGTGDMHAPGSDNPRCRCHTAYEIPRSKKLQDRDDQDLPF